MLKGISYILCVCPTVQQWWECFIENGIYVLFFEEVNFLALFLCTLRSLVSQKRHTYIHFIWLRAMIFIPSPKRPQDTQQIKATNCNCGLFYLPFGLCVRFFRQCATFNSFSRCNIRKHSFLYKFRFNFRDQSDSTQHSHLTHRVQTGNNILCQRKKKSIKFSFFTIDAINSQKKKIPQKVITKEILKRKTLFFQLQWQCNKQQALSMLQRNLLLP